MKNSIVRFLQTPRRMLVSGVMALGLLSFAILPGTALAAPQTTNGACAAKDVACVIQFGDQRITERLNALNTLNGIVTDDHTDKLIDDDHFNALTTDIQTNITGLNTIKTTLDAETVAKNARLDVASIYTTLRIYAVVLPRDYRRLHLAIEITVDNKLEGLKSTIETHVDNAPASVQSEVTALFTDYKAQLADAESKIDLAQQTWPLLTPDSYNTDRVTYKANEKTLTTDEQTAHADLHKAASDLHQIALDIKSAK